MLDNMKKYRKLIKDKKGVSHPLELLFAFGVIIVAFSLIFVAIAHMFTPYSKDEFVLEAKAMSVSERLIKDPGKTNTGDSDWEMHPARLEILGLAAYKIINDTWFVPPPINPGYVTKKDTVHKNSNLLLEIENLTITNYSYKISPDGSPIRIKNAISNKIDYGTLDLDKINTLNEIKYDTAKEALGLEEQYDFNIEIIDINDEELLKYGKSYTNAEVVGSFSRNIRIYHTYSTSYITAIMTIYIF